MVEGGAKGSQEADEGSAAVKGDKPRDECVKHEVVLETREVGTKFGLRG